MNAPRHIVQPLVFMCLLTFAALVRAETITAKLRDVSIDCNLARALSRSVERPAWFPFPQPSGYALRVNADALPIFKSGLKWTAGERYFWLRRLSDGANLGDPRAKHVLVRWFQNIGQRIEIIELSPGDHRLYAQWPTNGRYPDLTAVVSKGETLMQLTHFIESLRLIHWPASCP